MSSLEMSSSFTEFGTCYPKICPPGLLNFKLKVSEIMAEAERSL